MKKIIFLATILFAMSVFIGNVSAQMTAANSWLTNVVVATAANVMNAPKTAASNRLKVVTNFGGLFAPNVTQATCQRGTLGYTNWVFTFTNKGNATSIWGFSFNAAASNAGGAYWSYGIGGTSVQASLNYRSYTVTLAPAAFATIYVHMSNRATPPDGTSISLRIQATNTRRASGYNTMWTNYTGDNGTLYGGDMGQSWLETAGNPLADAYPGTVFMMDLGTPASAQGYISLKIATPILSITKTLVSSSIGGVASAPIPGAKLLYSIFVTNSGSGTALNMNVRDTVPTAYVSNFSIVALTNVALDAVASTIDTGAGPLAVWTNNQFLGKARAKIVFSVIIK